MRTKPNRLACLLVTRNRPKLDVYFLCVFFDRVKDYGRRGRINNENNKTTTLMKCRLLLPSNYIINPVIYIDYIF